MSKFIWNKSRDLENGLKRKHSKKEKLRIKATIEFCANLYIKRYTTNSFNIGIFKIKREFGERNINSILPRFAHIINIGNNISGERSTIKIKNIEELHSIDKRMILRMMGNTILDIDKKPIKFDFKSKSDITLESISNAIIESERIGNIKHLPFLKSLKLILESDKSIEIYYKRTKSGRMYPVWPGNLISIPKGIRQILLNGYNIDISNAITDFNISNLELVKHPLFAYYALESNNIKNFLMGELKADEGVIKSALHCVHVGGNFAAGQINIGRSSLLNIFENDYLATIDFTQKASQLLEAFKPARNETIDSYTHKDKESGKWVSVMPHSKEILSFDRRNQAKMFMAGYYDSEEYKRKILSELTNNFGLLVHDGIDGVLEDGINTIKNSDLPFRVKITHQSGKIEYVGGNKKLLSLKQILKNKNLSDGDFHFIEKIEKFKREISFTQNHAL